MQERFHAVCELTAELLAGGLVVYSPIAHNHYLACNFNLPRDWEFWQNLDLKMLDLANELHVLMLPGWEKSRGVAAEIKHAIETGKLVIYIEA